MSHDLVPVKIEIHPLWRRSPLGASQQPAIELPRFSQIAHWKRQVESRQSPLGCLLGGLIGGRLGVLQRGLGPGGLAPGKMGRHARGGMGRRRNGWHGE
jgi:hypothetical protein